MERADRLARPDGGQPAPAARTLAPVPTKKSIQASGLISTSKTYCRHSAVGLRCSSWRWLEPFRLPLTSWEPRRARTGPATQQISRRKQLVATPRGGRGDGGGRRPVEWRRRANPRRHDRPRLRWVFRQWKM